MPEHKNRSLVPQLAQTLHGRAWCDWLRWKLLWCASENTRGFSEVSVQSQVFEKIAVECRRLSLLKPAKKQSLRGSVEEDRSHYDGGKRLASCNWNSRPQFFQGNTSRWCSYHLRFCAACSRKCCLVHVVSKDNAAEPCHLYPPTKLRGLKREYLKVQGYRATALRERKDGFDILRVCKYICPENYRISSVSILRFEIKIHPT